MGSRKAALDSQQRPKGEQHPAGVASIVPAAEGSVSWRPGSLC